MSLNHFSVTKSIKKWLSLTLSFLLAALYSISGVPAFAAGNTGSTAIDLKGWSADINNKGYWTDGNLQKMYYEGCWVPYTITFENLQADYTVKDGKWINKKTGQPFMLIIEYDFTAGSKASRFMDAVRSISFDWNTSGGLSAIALGDLEAYPDKDGNALPTKTINELNYAQNLQEENKFADFSMMNLPDNQTNIAAGSYGGTLAANFGSTTTARRQCIITEADLKLADPGFNPSTVQNIVLYFQLELARSIIWTNGYAQNMASALNNDWGTWIYNQDGFPGDKRGGAGTIGGSSGQVRIGGSFGDQTVPNPQVPESTGFIKGQKFADVNVNHIWDNGEPVIANWPMNLYLKYGSGEFLAGTTKTDAGGYYTFPGVTQGMTWIVKEEEHLTAGDSYKQYFPYQTTSQGIATAISVQDPNNLYAGWGWSVPLTYSNLSQDNLNFGNFNGQPAFTIDKTGPAQSKNTDALTYAFTITNTGNVPLARVSVLDDKIGNITNDFPETLAVGETKTVNESWNIPADNTEDPYVNTVTAVYKFEPMGDVGVITQTDSWSTDIIWPKISMTKTADHTYATVGDEITYTITVKNEDTDTAAPKMNFNLSDTLLALPDADKSFSLTSGESKVITYKYTVPDTAGDVLTNTAKVTASPEGFTNVFSAEAVVNVDIMKPSIKVEKTAYNATYNPLTIACPGANLKYKYTITNTGNKYAYISLLNVIDTKIGDISSYVTDAGEILSPGESTTFEVPWTIPVDTITKEAYQNSVTATYELLNGTESASAYVPQIKVTADANYSINLFQPKIQIIKVGTTTDLKGNAAYDIIVKNISIVDNPSINIADVPALNFTVYDEKLLGSTVQEITLKVGETKTWNIPAKVYTKDHNKSSIYAYPVGFPEIELYLFF